jgi:hypothetical protein
MHRSGERPTNPHTAHVGQRDVTPGHVKAINEASTFQRRWGRLFVGFKRCLMPLVKHDI